MNAPDPFLNAPDWWLRAPWPLPVPKAEEVDPGELPEEGYETDAAGTAKG